MKTNINSPQSSAESSLKVLLAASEADPLIKVGGLADVVGSLALALTELGVDTRIIIPAYKAIKDKAAQEGKFSLKTAHEPIILHLGEKLKSVSFLRIDDFPYPVYLVEDPNYFDRDGVYGADPASSYNDNLERYAIFCKAVIQFLTEIGWIPDIIHAHDWHTALIPVYLKQIRGGVSPLSYTGSLFTIHNLAYQGVSPLEKFALLGIDTHKIARDEYEYYGRLNLMKLGILTADRLNTVSPNYRDETLAGGDAGAGLEGVLQTRRNHYHGILNGISHDEWSPENDSMLPQKFQGDWNAFKSANKEALIKKCGLSPASAEAPIIGLISRLVHQKGIDVLIETLNEIIERGCCVVILGSGDEDAQECLEVKARKYPGKIHLNFTHNTPLAHLMFAGVDMFLMPSRFEPCGLTQIIAMRFGTIPIVHNVGGLRNTVREFDSASGKGTGFKFAETSSHNVLKTLDKALNVYANKKLWRLLVRNAAAESFTWEKSAKRYLELYHEISTELKR